MDSKIDKLPLSVSYNFIVKKMPDNINSVTLFVCRYCKKKIRGSIKRTSNLITHVRRKHPADYKKFVILRGSRNPKNLMELEMFSDNSDDSEDLDDPEYFLTTLKEETSVKEMDLPFSITHNYILKDLPKDKNEYISIECKYCSKQIKGSIIISSNFIVHIKNCHPDEYEEFIKLKKQRTTKSEVKAESVSEQLSDNLNDSDDLLTDCNDDEENTTTNIELPFAISHNFIVKNLPQSRSEYMIVMCKYCKRKLKGSIKSTSNLIAHLKKCHPNEHEEYTRTKSARNTKADAIAGLSDDSASVLKEEEEEEEDTSEKPIEIPFSISHNFIVEQMPENRGSYISATCKYCKRKCRGSLQITSNFLAHTRRSHPAEYAHYIKIKPAKETLIARATDQLYQKVSIHHNEKNMPKGDQKFVKNLIVNYLINAMKPPSEVENETFKAMIHGLRPIAMPTQHNIKETIHKQYMQIKANISDIINEIDYISSTTSILSCGKHIFIGISLHWIDENSFEHKTILLCIRRFIGQLNPEQISAFIADIYQEFDIVPEKVVKTTINGDLNEINGVSLFDINPHQTDNLADDPLVFNYQEDNIRLEKISNTSLLTYNDVEEIFKNHEDHELPPYHKCSSYMLNLLLVKDTVAAIREEPLYLKQIFESTFAKCSALFTKLNRSIESSRVFNEYVGELPKSDFTRWSSEYDLLIILNRTSNETLTQALNLLDIDEFSDCEYQCLQEYAALLKPIVEALLRLENEKCSFYGEVVPVLYTLKTKLEMLCENKVLYCNNIRGNLILQLTNRFNSIFGHSFEASDALLASISNPYFRRRWIKNNESLNQYVTDLLLSTADSMVNDSTPNEDANMELKSDKNDDNYFGFDDTPDSEVSTNDIKNQIKTYLEDKDTSYGCLNKYPVVRNIFFLTNTTLQSTAKTERIFAEAVIILFSQGSEWDENLLEKQLYCKYNSTYLALNK